MPMPRRTRKSFVGRTEDYERREREKSLRVLLGELRREWREQSAGTNAAAIAPTEPATVDVEDITK